MNKCAFLFGMALASCVGMALSYGKINQMPMNTKFTGYPYMANMQSFGHGGFGYMPVGGAGYGGFGGSGGGAGMGGMFGSIIQLFIFIFVINLLFSSTGIGSGGLGGIGGIGGSKKSSHHKGSDYGYYDDTY